MPGCVRSDWIIPDKFAEDQLVGTPPTYLMTSNGSLRLSPLISKQSGSMVCAASISSQFIASMELAQPNPAAIAVSHM